MIIKIAARDSNLSKAQVKEFQKQLIELDPSIQIDPYFLKSYGDLNHQISLREQGYDDLFTKEIDEAVIKEEVDLALHSAKDLPTKISENLEVFYLSPSIHPSDALVMKEGFSIDTMPKHAVIMASSLRREESIRDLREDLICKDVRGTIEQRLAYLNHPEIYGVVVAEAALIRLNLEHLNRIILQAKTHPMQGMLAAVGLKKNVLLKEFLRQLK